MFETLAKHLVEQDPPPQVVYKGLRISKSKLDLIKRGKAKLSKRLLSAWTADLSEAKLYLDKSEVGLILKLVKPKVVVYLGPTTQKQLKHLTRPVSRHEVIVYGSGVTELNAGNILLVYTGYKRLSYQDFLKQN
jgi:hypothetical protein